MENQATQIAESNKAAAAENLGVTKERTPSAIGTIKSLATNIKRIKTLGLANVKDVETLEKLHEKIVKQYLGAELGL